MTIPTARSGLAAAALALAAASAAATPVDRSVIPLWRGTAPLSGAPVTSVLPAWHGSAAAPADPTTPDLPAPVPAAPRPLPAEGIPTPGSTLGYGSVTPGPAASASAFPTAASAFPTAEPELSAARSPIPLPRPAALGAGSLVVASLIPPARPRTLAVPTPESDGEPPASDVTLTPPQPDLPGAGEGTLCGDPAIVGQMRVPVVSTNPSCGIEAPVSLTQIAGVRLSHPATVDCYTARALSVWMRGAVIPAGRAAGLPVAMIDVGDSYACRPRNNVAGNKISEHGKGHAFDIMAIRFAGGDQAVVLDDWGQGAKGRFLAQIRHAACGPFTTVLGPGSDPYHRNHLHLDTARGRNAYCH